MFRLAHRSMSTASSVRRVQPMFSMLKHENKGAMQSFVPEQYRYTVKKAWFSDPATYPLLVVLCSAGTFIVGMAINAFVNYKDIRVNPDHKHDIIQDWRGHHPQRMVTRAIGTHPIGMNARKYKTIQHEGLGVDHEEWKKEKLGRK